MCLVSMKVESTGGGGWVRLGADWGLLGAYILFTHMLAQRRRIMRLGLVQEQISKASKTSKTS